MASESDHVAVLDQRDAVRQADRRQAVSYDQGRPVGHELPERCVYPLLDLRVDGAGGIVEDQHRWVDQQSAGDGQPLTLAARQGVAALAYDRVIAFGEPDDELVGIGRFGRGHNLVQGSPGPAVSNVVAHRDREQERLVEDEADMGTQALERVIAYIEPVN